jgi:hypothetical protein
LAFATAAASDTVPVGSKSSVVTLRPEGEPGPSITLETAAAADALVSLLRADAPVSFLVGDPFAIGLIDRLLRIFASCSDARLRIHKPTTQNNSNTPAKKGSVCAL